MKTLPTLSNPDPSRFRRWLVDRRTHTAEQAVERMEQWAGAGNVYLGQYDKRYWVFLLRICARPDCPEPLPYEGAEYCGAGCAASERR